MTFSKMADRTATPTGSTRKAPKAAPARGANANAQLAAMRAQIAGLTTTVESLAQIVASIVPLVAPAAALPRQSAQQQQQSAQPAVAPAPAKAKPAAKAPKPAKAESAWWAARKDAVKLARVQGGDLPVAYAVQIGDVTYLVAWDREARGWVAEFNGLAVGAAADRAAAVAMLNTAADAAKAPRVRV